MARHAPEARTTALRLRAVGDTTLLTGSVVVLILGLAAALIWGSIQHNAAVSADRALTSQQVQIAHASRDVQAAKSTAGDTADVLAGCRQDISMQDDAVASLKDVLRKALPLMRDDITSQDYTAFDGHVSDIEAAEKAVKGVTCG